VTEKEVVRTEAAPAPFQGAPYSQAIKAAGFVFVSGQLALEPGHTELRGGTIREQTEQIFANLRAILEEAGSSLDRLVKTTVFLQNLDDFQGMNEVYARHVGDMPPARSTVEVARLPSGALVEIEAVALLSCASRGSSTSGRSWRLSRAPRTSSAASSETFSSTGPGSTSTSPWSAMRRPMRRRSRSGSAAAS
jgi:2-iminobutanoate/2-iminopropanoate deaminase